MPFIEHTLCTSLASADALPLLSLVQPHCSFCYHPNISTSHPFRASAHAVLLNLPQLALLHHSRLSANVTSSVVPSLATPFKVSSPLKPPTSLLNHLVLCSFSQHLSLLKTFYLLLVLSIVYFTPLEYKVLESTGSVLIHC